jgi:hypothetical protein
LHVAPGQARPSTSRFSGSPKISIFGSDETDEIAPLFGDCSGSRPIFYGLY